jgi:DNA polymerase-1
MISERQNSAARSFPAISATRHAADLARHDIGLGCIHGGRIGTTSVSVGSATAGLRIDFLLLSAQSAKRLKDAGVDREVRGAEGASDQAPAWTYCGMPNRGGLPIQPSVKIQRVVTELGCNGGTVLSSDHCWLSTATRSRIAHITAFRNSIVRRGGKGAGAIVGFAHLLLRLYREERPRAVLVGWDTLTAPTHKKFPAYQSRRQFDDALIEQLDTLPEFVAACGFANAKAPGYEADDFLAAAVATEERCGRTALVASGDRDTFQLASESTTIIFPVRAGEMARIGPAEVRERYGVSPKQVSDFIALRGDPSDKLPGARGVGPKGAADLLGKYGTLEDILAAGRFVEQAKMLRLYRSIATMDASASLPALPDQTPTWTHASHLVRDWELSQLADRLEEMAKVSHG